MGLFGVANTVMAFGATYLVVMMIGARILRRPPAGWKPAGWKPEVKAIETADAQLRRIVEAVHGKGGALLITADHGNADHMLEPDGSPNTAHSLNPVPLIVTVADARLERPGVLADVAPTVLELLGIEQPAQMTGHSLIEAG